MARLDHERPILKLIDAIRRRKSAAAPKPHKNDLDMYVQVPKVLKRQASLITSIPITLAAERKLVQSVALEILAHIEKHHDCSDVQRLLDCVARPKERAALEGWFLQFGRVRRKDGRFCLDRRKSLDRDVASLTPYWNIGSADAKEPNPRRRFNLRNELEKLVAAANEFAAKREVGAEIDPELLRELKDILGRNVRVAIKSAVPPAKARNRIT